MKNQERNPIEAFTKLNSCPYKINHLIAIKEFQHAKFFCVISSSTNHWLGSSTTIYLTIQNSAIHVHLSVVVICYTFII